MIKRKLVLKLRKHLKQKEISLIIGPRQAGKTTIMKLLAEELKTQGEQVLFLNHDREPDQQFFASQSTLIQKINSEFGDKKGYVFLDEIQRKENAGLFLKGIYDSNLPHKFIVSGSGSLELKEKIHESLAGRKRVFILNTVSFFEFVDYKTNYSYKSLTEFLGLDKITEEQLLKEYLDFGGYPRVILSKKVTDKFETINEILNSYLERDISYLGVDKPYVFRELLKLLASQIGQTISYQTLSNALNISIQTLKKYLWYAEKTFVIIRIYPFTKRRTQEITKAPVYYFTDLGLRNFLVGLFGNSKTLKEESFLFENLVFLLLDELSREKFFEIRFWRTKSGAEVDFVLLQGLKPTPVEVKFQSLKSPKITRSLSSFIKKYNPEKALVINRRLEGKVTVRNTQVYFLPYFKIVNFFN